MPFAVRRFAVDRRGGARCGCRRGDDALRIEAVIEEVRGAIGDQPRRRTVDDQRTFRRETFAVAAFERRQELVAVAHRAQAQAAYVDIERYELHRMPVGAGFVVEARTRMARQPEECARECALRDACTERFLHRFIADQFAVGIIPIIGRRRFHHRKNRLGVSDHTAQARRVEIQGPREYLAIGR